MSDQTTTKHKRTLEGVVTSNKMQDTIVVRVEYSEKHPLYGKYMSRSTKFHVNDKGNKCQIGDHVSIQECRPLSKTKNWQLVDIIEKAQ